jgi:hypothetical protein
MAEGRNGTPWASCLGRLGPAALVLAALLGASTGVQPLAAGRALHEAPMTVPAGALQGKRPFAIDLYRPGAFVSQATTEFCIPAAIITMINTIDRGRAQADVSQERLYRLARRLSTWRLVGGGAEAEGWAGVLNGLGYGPYAVHVAATRGAALSAAARALRLTGKPVGLIMWRGAHAWVMSGFRATADPAVTSRFSVTHVTVEDPWYPRASSIWRRSPRPDSTVSVDVLVRDLLPFRRPTVRYPDKDGRFVLVVPVATAPADLQRSTRHAAPGRLVQ